MIPLPVCRWRGESHDSRCVCYSTKFVGAPSLVPESFCHKCYYIDHATPTRQLHNLPCVHLGGPTGALIECPSCKSNVQLKLFACTLHGQCTPARINGDLPDARNCHGCSDYLSRDLTSPNSAQMLRQADAFLAAIPDYPHGRYQGRGIVIAGGGERYFPSLYVTIRAVRHVGCTLPIQVWYLGRDDEMPADRRAILAPYGVECIDADEVRKRHPARRLHGWELKVFATLHSLFEEVLFLDADCYPCRNPEFLFELEDYRERGAIFWPDMATFDQRLKWPAFGIADPQRPGSVESGQYLLNKQTSWRPLNLAWHYNDFSDYYYHYCYGDKHTFEVAWTRCEQPFVMWTPHAVWDKVAYLHPGPDNETLFVHRCADKFRFERHDYITNQNTAAPVFQASRPVERECWGWMAELAPLVGRTSEEVLFQEVTDD